MRSLLLLVVSFGIGCGKEEADGKETGTIPVEGGCGGGGGDCDGDPYTPSEGDCDDDDPARWPGNPEVCDGVDQDCNGIADDRATDASGWYEDADADGYGTAPVAFSCSQPVGWVADSADCDDAAPEVNPGEDEFCNGIDDNCDGAVDEDCDGTADAAASCAEILSLLGAGATDGVARPDPDGAAGRIAAFDGYCNQSDDGGGRTLVLKTDATSTAHYTAAAVDETTLDDATLNAVAKYEDAVIQALQVATAATGEIRLDGTGLSETLIVEGIDWEMVATSYSTTGYGRLGSAGAGSTGYPCYDGDCSTYPPCGSDPWCVGMVGGEHACLRRFATAGIWFNWGIYPSGYYAGSVWVR